CHLLYSICFFFSSRRRHTRFSRDWSSDVCSSDLSCSSSLSQRSTASSRYRAIPPSRRNGGPVPAERHRDRVDSETFKYAATSRLSSRGERSASVLSLTTLLRCPGRGRGRTLPLPRGGPGRRP